jgi:hypothetical protein
VSTVSANQYCTGRVSINILPDEILLQVFQFYRADSLDPVSGTWGWQRLVHVCRAWRRTILESQNALDLRLLCTERTPVRRTIDVWPRLPIIIEYRHVPNAISESAIPKDLGDLVAALRHNVRVCRITLSLTGPLVETVTSAMRQPYPMLTYLRVQLAGDAASSPALLPDGFLGGQAPRLQKMWLDGIRFPSLPKFLLGASGLVELRLDKIPDTWGISPQTLASCLSTLPKLSSLSIEFQYPQPLPEPTLRNPSHPTRYVLPSLAILFYKGESEYLEDLVSQIDAPRLSYAFIKFFNQLIFDIAELPRFISRTEKLRTLNRAEAFFDGQAVGIGFYRPETTVPRNLTVRIACVPSDWQLSSLAQLCNRSPSLLSGVEQLDIRDCHSRESHLQEMMQWVDLFHPFTRVESLRIPRELGSRIAPVLRELTEPRAAEVLPALNSLIFEELEPPSSESGSLQRAIDGFIAARERSGHPIDVRRWDDKWERDMEWEWDLAREWERDLVVKD